MTATAMRYCDLVMKGGVTSGVVYPSVILALCEKFRFKNIGGTSAGAIAAATAAAASLGERRQIASPGGDARSGFSGLAAVAQELRRDGVIRSQFQPVTGSKTAFGLLELLAGPASGLRKGAGLVGGVVMIAPVATVVTFGLVLGIGLAGAHLAAWWTGGSAGGRVGMAGIAGAAVPALALALLAAIIASLWQTAKVVRGNFFGLCSGMPGVSGKPSAGTPAFTEWLHQTLQSLSGKSSGDPPLLFEELWNAARYPDEPATEKTINLQLITTSVSHREPRTLPFAKAPFWFRTQDFDRLFPQDVVAWLVDHAGERISVDGVAYYRLPASGQMPVVVATRMSLSFPFLFSAIPLYEPDWSNDARAAGGAATKPQAHPFGDHGLSEDNESVAGDDHENHLPRSFRICWFSDGGICNNFPLHLFDAPLPNWPTFAIDLLDPAKSTGQLPENDPEASIFLPTHNNQGWQRTYRAIGNDGVRLDVLNLLKGIVGSARSWREQLQARSPGHRDRIVRISLAANEGGFNLDMRATVLENLHQKGLAAGRRLDAFSFANHYWIRWRNVSASMQRFIIAIARSDRRHPKIPAYEQIFATAKTGEPPPVSYKFGSRETAAAAQALLAELIEKGSHWHDQGPDLSEGAPRQAPHFQIAPVFDDSRDIFRN